MRNGGGCGGGGGGGVCQPIKVLRSRVYPYGHLPTIEKSNKCKNIMNTFGKKCNNIFHYL